MFKIKNFLRWSRLRGWLLLLLPAMAIAAIVTSQQVAQAILNSPNASAALKQYASAIGNLAINVESGGNTEAYNGSCCYGVLQMTKSNIKNYAHMSETEYQKLDLQSQVNYWAKLTSPLLDSATVQRLVNMGTFDGRPVDGNMVLACMQLGVGNCKKMINSGLCSGFADRNGTTICSMADKIANGSWGGGNDNGGGGGGGGGGGEIIPCVRDASGVCLPVDEAMAQQFQSGAGFSMAALKKMIYSLIGGGMLLLSIGIIKDAWRLYSAGTIEQPALYRITLRIAVCVSLVLMVMQYNN